MAPRLLAVGANWFLRLCLIKGVESFAYPELVIA